MTMRIRIWLDELERLPEYSTSIPTCVCPWKTWKARTYIHGDDDWHPSGPFVVRQYGETRYPDGKAFCQFEVELLQGPRRGNEQMRFKTVCSPALK